MIKAPTFSITAGNETWPGRLRVMSQAMGVTVISSYRHSFATLQVLAEDALRSLNSEGQRLFREVVVFYAVQPEVLDIGLSNHRRNDLVRQFELAGQKSHAEWVRQISMPVFAAVVEHARWNRAFPGEPYASGLEPVEGSAPFLHVDRGTVL